MSKELFVSSTPHETKVAIVEDDQLAEIYYERENEYTLAGSIYKGRVTRVLPGMQSAFVNIGLERDAFLYVSDFLLEEEDDTDDLEQAVSRARVIESPRPETPRESIEAPRERRDRAHAPEGEEITHAGESAANGGTAATEHEQAAPDDGRSRSAEVGEQDREGARKWRGRRRRRGRGGRFQDREDHPERSDRPERPERNDRSEHAEASTAARPERPEPPVSHGPADEPILLPGESISKYQPHSESKPRAVAAAKPSSQTARPSTEYSLSSADFSPDSMVLPGESISKYRGQSAPPPPPPPRPTSVIPAPTVQEERTESAIEEHGFRQDAESAGPIPHSHELAQEERYSPTSEPREEASHAGANISPLVIPSSREAEPRWESQPLGPEVQDQTGALDQPEIVEETVEMEQEELSTESESAESAPSRLAQPESTETFRASGSGLLEEEEIEEEESELPGYEEDADLSEFDELEEEVMGQDQIAAGRELIEAVRDAHVNERTTGQYEPEGHDTEDTEDLMAGVFGAGNEDLDEEEEPGAEEPGGEEHADDLEGARAEHRAAGTAGYQQPQRSDRRPGDRRGGRRPGRRNMRGRRYQAPRQMPAISDLLKEGQEILVQIAKEPIAKKGARITSHIALPGRFLVYMPTVHHTGVSRKIASEEERHRLKRIALSERGEAQGGFIVRTAAAGANEDDLRADIRFLINLWNEIRGRADNSKAPSLIYHDLNLVERILRDQVTTSFSAVWVDTEQEYERVVRFVSRFQPSLLKRVKLYSKETPLFEQFSITDEINKALKSKVWLKSGGYIVINQTEALVAIDVNTGKYVGKTARLEDTIVRTNIDAIREIVRQIRLRDLGGIIVIDFIDMDERKNRQKVMQALEEALRADRAPSKVLQFNDFGLVAITRKRVKQSLERTLGQPCPTCQATGMIKSVTTVCNEIYVEMRKMSRHFEHDIMLRVNPEVAKALKANAGRWVQEMEELTRHTVLVKSDPLLHLEHFDIQ
jgi:Rne/Rng family ribonuclease